MKIIERPVYLERISHYLHRDTIIILTGQRRVGKSYLLRSLRDKLEAEETNNVIFIDKEKKEYDPISSYRELNAYIDERRKEGANNYILIDEIQDIEGFERSLRAYYEEEDIELIVTGSNSEMLSSELSTIIGGRYKEIYIQSLSYSEFLSFHNLEDSEDSLMKYLRFGGLPGLIRTGFYVDEVLEYQNDVLNTVLIKDIIMRHNIRNAPFLQNLIKYLSDNDGKLISATNIARYMKSGENAVSPGLILDYMSYMAEAYIVKKVDRFDIHGKKLFENNNKYYFQDIGIRNALVTGVRSFDIEKVVENAVYNQLLFLGFNVTIGQLRDKEIDFVATRNGYGPIYIQAAYIIGSEETYNREFGNLKAIKDNHPKYVISMTPLMDGTDDGGIRHISLRRFLNSTENFL